MTYHRVERYGFIILFALLLLVPSILGFDPIGAYLDVTVVPLLRLFTGVASSRRRAGPRRAARAVSWTHHRSRRSSRRGASARMTKKRILTGYRPTGKLHLGHWFGNLQNMRELQEEYDAYYFVADWHALTTRLGRHARASASSPRRWCSTGCAAGLDPAKCTIYRQSDVPEVAELTMYFSMVTPMTLARARAVLQGAARADHRQGPRQPRASSSTRCCRPPTSRSCAPTCVPVGEDQLPHLELTREIVRRFNNVVRRAASSSRRRSSPKEGARVPGTDGRKMSKSYGNAIYISDDARTRSAPRS